MLTVVMYHYIRPLSESAFPRLKALDLQDFRGQVDWLLAHHRMITPQDLALALQGGPALPENACLLTFDDGYSDHYQHAAPVLDAHGIKGLFFAPAASLLRREMLEVNKIQLILAVAEQPEALASELDAFLAAEGEAEREALHAQYFSPNRYDTAPVAYVKRLLQHGLPAALRSRAIDALFARYVSEDAAALAEGFYLTPDQAREMRAKGHEFGGHGDLHLWHGEVGPSDLAREVAGSVAALKAIGAPREGGFYCYPFGSHSPAVLDAVAAAGFQTGFSVKPERADLKSVTPLAIPRLDTNDLPKSLAGASGGRA